jgi:hypothetical protein
VVGLALNSGGIATMEALGFALIIILVIVAGLGFWWLRMSMDKDRITDYIQQRGGRIVSISWAPFGRGWFGEKEERLYEVVYYDQDGNQHFAIAKTSLLTGVYWTDDRITHPKAAWYGRLPQQNVAGNPIIRHIPKAAEEERIETDAAEARGRFHEGATTAESADEEIDRLKKRLAELEQKKREGQA